MLKPKAPAPTIDFLSTVERTMQVLEFLADEPDGLTVSELARRLGINKSIALRILATLEATSYLYRETDTQRYRLTYRIANLALRQLARSGLLDQCGPCLRELAERTGELVRLAIIQERRPIWVHAVSGPQRQLRVDPVYGHEIVLHIHAAGKAWLMTLDDAEIDALLGPGVLKARTKYSLTTRRALKADLDIARTRGFAISFEEGELGVGAVAAPILLDEFAHAGRAHCVGVVSVAAPISRMDRGALSQAGELVVEAAHQLAKVWPSSLVSTMDTPLRAGSAR